MKILSRLFAAVGGIVLLACGTTACVAVEEAATPAEIVVPAEEAATPAATIVPAEPPPPPAVDIWTAAAEGDLEQLEAHKRAGTNLDELQLDTGVTPLMIAIIVGQQEAAEWLLGNGADANVEMRDGGNALHGAAFVGNADAAELLMRHGVDVNAVNSQSDTVGDILALDWGTTEYISDMLQLGLMQDQVEAGRGRIRALLGGGAGEGGGAGDILGAVSFGDAASVRALLGGGADANATGPDGTPLIMIAASAGHADVVAVLVEAGANVDEPSLASGATALHAAAVFGRAEAAKALLDGGADATVLTNDGATAAQLLELDWATTEYIAEMVAAEVEQEALMAGRKKIADMLNAR